jgi:hypothetical protein
MSRFWYVILPFLCVLLSIRCGSIIDPSARNASNLQIQRTASRNPTFFGASPTMIGRSYLRFSQHSDCWTQWQGGSSQLWDDDQARTERQTVGGENILISPCFLNVLTTLKSLSTAELRGSYRPIAIPGTNEPLNGCHPCLRRHQSCWSTHASLV